MKKDALELLGLPAAEARLIRFFLLRPNEGSHLREVQRLLGLGGASVQRALERLVELGALERSEQDGRPRYSVAANSAAWRALHLIASQPADPLPLMREAFIDVGGVEAAFVFGSFAAGRSHANSDVDVFLVASASLDKKTLHHRTAATGLLLGREVNMVRYTTEQLGERLGRRSSAAWAFLYDVLRGPKQWVAGTSEALVPVALAAGIKRDELLGGTA